MDIADFLAARYDEEQHLAQWAAKPHVGPQELGDTAVWQVEEWVASEHEDGAVPAAIWVTDRSEMGIGQMRPDRGIAAHVAYWDPARVLADLAAKRRRLERHRTYDFPPGADDGPGDYSWTPHCDACHEPWPCFDLRNDAAPYAACEDYDNTWSLDA
jgi:hypothetical protein